MRRRTTGFVTLLVAVLAAGTAIVTDTVPTVTETVTTASPASPLSPAFIKASGRDLMLDGKSVKLTGFNFYNANSDGNDCAYAGNLNDLSTWGSGIGVVRAWFFQRFVTVNGARDWSKFDALLAAAKADGIYVIPVLGDEWDNGCDTAQKTLGWYQTGYKSVDSGYLTSYRQFAVDFVTRYKDDPTIAMIQLMNEPDGRTGSTCDESAAVAALTAFATNVSGAIKMVDPNHLVMLGAQGSGQCGMREGDYQTVMGAAGNDVCEYHDFYAPGTAIGGNDYNGEQLRLNQCAALSKPLIVGEAGIQRTDVPDLQTRANDFAAKIDAQFAAGASAFLVWNWWDCTVATSDQWKVCLGDPTIGVLQAR